jgi:hypothetical protein
MIGTTFSTNFFMIKCFVVDISGYQIALLGQLLNRTDIGPCPKWVVGLPGHRPAWWSH